MEKHITMHECFCDTREDNPDILHLVWSFGRAYFLLPEHVVRKSIFYGTQNRYTYLKMASLVQLV